MQAHMNNLRSSVILGVAALLATVSGLSCYERPDSFQPITYGAKPWNPPAGWDPEPACATGYYVAINTCEGCKDISYALCTGTIFTSACAEVLFGPARRARNSLSVLPTIFRRSTGSSSRTTPALAGPASASLGTRAALEKAVGSGPEVLVVRRALLDPIVDELLLIRGKRVSREF